MSLRQNGSLYVFFGLAVLLAAIPFVIHYVLLGEFWYDAKNGEWAFFLPFWLAVSVLDFMIGNTVFAKPSKNNALFIILVSLTVISFIGSIVMMMVFNVNVMYYDYDFGCFLLSFLTVAVSHLIPVISLFHPQKYSLQELWDIGDSPSWIAGGSDYDDFQDDLDPSQDWGDDYNMTKDYYGKHGEFDYNDDSWGTSEYIRQFHNNDPDVDLSDHFDWQERLDAETDGFLEED